MKRALIMSATILMLLVKYLQMSNYLVSIPMLNLVLLSIGIASSILIILSALKFLEGKWRVASISIAILAIITLLLWNFYTSPAINFLWSLFLFTSNFLVFYAFCHYEIRKFPAFGYSFSLIYIMAESISQWRGDTDPIFFLIFLTIMLPMYIVGILKIKE